MASKHPFYDSFDAPVLQAQGFQDVLDYKLVLVPEEVLYFDPTNPRLALDAEEDESKGVPNIGSQEWIYDKLCADREHAKTAEGIKQTKGAFDEVLVWETKVDGKLVPVVLEGNRTTAIFRKHHRAGIPGFDKIRCKIFRSITEEQIDMLLSIKHIKGKKRWGSYNDAKALNAMLERGIPIKRMATHLGKDAKELEIYLNAYRLHARIQKDMNVFNPNFFTICLRFADAPQLWADYDKSKNGWLYQWFRDCVAQKKFKYTGLLSSPELTTIARSKYYREKVLTEGAQSIRQELEGEKLKGQADKAFKRIEFLPQCLTDVDPSTCEKIQSNETERLKCLQAVSNAQKALNDFLPNLLAPPKKKPDTRNDAASSNAA